MMNPVSPYTPVDPATPFLLASDIDGTLLGDDEGEAWLNEFSRQYSDCFKLALITGRSLQSVLQVVEEGRLPRPDFICGNVGTTLLDLNDPDNLLGKRYAAQVASGWDLETIYARGVGPGIWRQDFPEGQPPFQAGFYWDGEPESLHAFFERMSPEEDYHLLESFSKFIDVYPGPLGKGNAALFLQKELGLAAGKVVVAGDTGNDRPMFETGLPGILPVNALDELRQAAGQPWHYHSPYPAARGVLDGLKYFRLIV